MTRPLAISYFYSLVPASPARQSHGYDDGLWSQLILGFVTCWLCDIEQVT